MAQLNVDLVRLEYSPFRQLVLLLIFGIICMSAYNVLIEYHWVSKINSTPDIVRTTCIERLWGTMYILHLQSVVGSLMVNLTLCISHVNKNPQTGLQLSYHLDRKCCLILINGNSAELFLNETTCFFIQATKNFIYHTTNTLFITCM